MLTIVFERKAQRLRAHQRLITDLYVTETQRPMIHCTGAAEEEDARRYQSVNTVKALMQDKASRSKESMCVEDNVLLEYLGHQEYIDTLQIPLQPLADNLDSGTYAVFEEDVVKYTMYREAISHAIEELVEIVADQRQIVVYLLGAGRGPLV
ncbi:unnamed protein product, partial [Gongylonema pulchrum]|uniref:PRMT5 domain-containing protein n=1 Tax=Gongylonema pulchrum TaxID=637853 RepID=A0A183DMZ2_9BILA